MAHILNTRRNFSTTPTTAMITKTITTTVLPCLNQKTKSAYAYVLASKQFIWATDLATFIFWLKYNDNLPSR
ncbi:hypothetical protein RCL_jg13011.t1 [Rhizophagus clarus]|uniref:Uncharacterized protein n=1 Tax=Rhizophagus clarus TaxID=94130 RepID=A0A8H3KS96_9GLOM|nr:hypothetical protein RCL_jg13011.t1 [Rhizophagus clarus]